VDCEIDYPGWKAGADNQPAALESAGNPLRRGRVPAGKHEIALVYVPLSFYSGLAASLPGWIIFWIMARSYVKKLAALFRSALS